MGWPSEAAASLFFARPRKAAQPPLQNTQRRNVVRFRRRMATQHRT